MTFRPLPVLTICAALALVLTVWLGFWQWDRFEQKRSRAAAPPPAVEMLEGAPRLDAVSFVFGDWNGPGWRVFAPVDHAGETVFVDVGFAPGVDFPAAPPTLELAPPLAVTRVPAHRPGRFAAAPDFVRRAFYSVDLPAMASASGVEAETEYYFAAAYRGTDGAPVPNPFAVATEPLPPVRHLGYAVTWWGLAASLIGVYLALHARLGRLKFR